MRFNTGRFVLSLILIFGIQFVLSMLLSQFFDGIILVLAYSIAISFLFGIINYPRQLRGQMFKDPYFYRYVCIMFLIIFAFNIIF